MVAHDPPGLVRAGRQEQFRQLVGAGELRTWHERVVRVAPSGGAVQGGGDPGRVAGSGEVAGKDEGLLDE
ncbi:hypothetical protein Slala04_02150 [Streptomyces lavendulae subsp. lavendulae]|nr:hypothetical protein Slala04_02150 [Streptomyces lavendulae subsp. lavendulae]